MELNFARLISRVRRRREFAQPGLLPALTLRVFPGDGGLRGLALPKCREPAGHRVSTGGPSPWERLHPRALPATTFPPALQEM